MPNLNLSFATKGSMPLVHAFAAVFFHYWHWQRFPTRASAVFDDGSTLRTAIKLGPPRRITC